MITDDSTIMHWVEEASYMDSAWPTELEPEGMTVLSAHWQSCFYFWGGHTKAKRAALAECIEQYIKLFDDKLTSGFKTQPNGKSGQFGETIQKALIRCCTIIPMMMLLNIIYIAVTQNGRVMPRLMLFLV